MQVLYLGISGVLHPSASTYELVERRSPWADGHTEYEAVPWLAKTLKRWPDLRIVLTSTQPRLLGPGAVKAQLGSALSARVIGNTYEDLTTKVWRLTRAAESRQHKIAHSVEDYWRMNKSDIVAAHVAWLHPSAWVAVDDEEILWRRQVREHLVIVDGCRGLLHPAEQYKLVSALEHNFERESG